MIPGSVFPLPFREKHLAHVRGGEVVTGVNDAVDSDAAYHL